MVESLQHKLDRVRPPRVQITYDVEIGGAIVMKEIPFVVGIISDLAGVPVDPLPKLKERKFVEIDRDNFNDIMEKVKPRLPLRVDNKLTNDNGHMSAELFFHSIEDFDPLNIVKQVEPLAKLYEARTHLKDLLTKLDGNDALDELLQEIIQSTQQRDAIKAELGITDQPAPAAPPSATPAS